MASSSSLSPSSMMNLLPQSATQTRSKVHRLEHTWTIDHFNYHCDDKLHREDYLQSSKFSPHKFNQERLQFFLRVHPRGDVEKVEETEDNVPIYLHIESNKHQSVSIKAKVSLVKASGEKCNTKEDTKELSNNGILGWNDFVRRDYLLNADNGLLSDNQLTICCEIMIHVTQGQYHNKFTENQLTKEGKCKHVLKSESLNSLSQSWTKTCWKIDKFSHVWTIDNFSNLNLTGEFPSIFSSRFHSPDNPEYKFSLEFCPKGDNAETKDYICIYLHSYGKKVNVNFAISLLNDKGEEYIKYRTPYSFPNLDNVGFGWPNYISRATLFESSKQLLPDEKLTFYCEISNFMGIKISSSSSAIIQEDNFCLSQMAIDFGNLMQKHTQCDITFVIGDSKFPAHKLIFSARSPVFEKMFEHDLEENQKKQVIIVDMEAEVFEKFMKFVYSGKVDKLSKYDEKLLIVSDKYQMDSLKRICEASLSSKLCPESVIDIIVLADMHNAKQLKADSIEFIKSEGSSIIKMSSFNDLRKNYPALACEVTCSLLEYLDI